MFELRRDAIANMPGPMFTKPYNMSLLQDMSTGQTILIHWANDVEISDENVVVNGDGAHVRIDWVGRCIYPMHLHDPIQPQINLTIVVPDVGVHMDRYIGKRERPDQPKWIRRCRDMWEAAFTTMPGTKGCVICNGFKDASECRPMRCPCCLLTIHESCMLGVCEDLQGSECGLTFHVHVKLPVCFDKETLCANCAQQFTA